MQKELEMMSELINSYGIQGIGIIGLVGLISIKSIFKKKNDDRNQNKTEKPLNQREKLIENLTDYEMKRMPNQSKNEARKLALERWERDRS